jgi:hypothetical protein
LEKSSAVVRSSGALLEVFSHMLTRGQPYVEAGIQAFEAQRRDRQLRALARNARKLGFSLVEEAA